MPGRSRESRLAPKSTKEKRDDDIMLTNDSSIVSKQSVVNLYHSDHPDFFRPFVAKSQRRSPLINRGYWLRMKAIEQTVVNFLQESQEKEKLVVNLGCGYDPLPFQFLHQQPQLCAKATFVDVDYPQLMLKKRACIRNDATLQELLPFLASGSSKTEDIWHAGQYLAVGCDLRNLAELENVLRKEARIHHSAALFIAEVSVAYMDVKSADKVVSWASSFKDSRFCLLEQCLPEGPSHPFARTMLSHFEKLHTHLKVVYEYPTLSSQESRFRKAGWAQAKARTLWELWSDDNYIQPEKRKELDYIEPFDEWEEFALFGGHYLLLVARAGDATKTVTQDPATTSQDLPLNRRVSLRLEAHPHNAEASLRRFGATYSYGNKVIIHGGYGEQSRLSDFDVYSGNATFESRVDRQPVSLGELMCHTVTNVASGDDLFLLAGGRASPSRAMDKTWLVTSTGRCISADSFNKGHIFNGRYRHCAVPVTIDGRRDAPGVLIYGGKSDASSVLGDFLLFDLKKQSWSRVPPEESIQNGDAPPPRFGATMCKFGTTSTDGGNDEPAGILLGGISEHGSILDDVWTWSLSWKDGNPFITYTDRTAEMIQSATGPRFASARFGANMLPCSEKSFLLIGGVTKDSILRWDEEVLYVTFESEPRVQRIGLPACPNPRPLFVGMGAAKINDRIVLAGGGGVCFSMGSFWNTHSYSLELNLGEEKQQQKSPTESSDTEQKNATIGTQIPAASGSSVFLPAPIKPIERISIRTREDFDAIVAQSQPVILTGLDIGPCVSLWTPDYLLSQIGASRPVIVHSCPTSRMTFATKNFSYLKQSFGDFMSAVTSGGQLYLRSVASTQPAKHATHLSKDFPSIAADFRLPNALSRVTDNMHSSPLRISGPVALWLHYDVLANVLCQIRGAKRLRLYPPSDVRRLSYPPGASSSNIDVYTPSEELSEAQRAGLRGTHPHEAFLQPGDVLFIPPAWSHTAKPEDGLSVAVNCFWRNLGDGVYAQGRDVYGNRDIAAYEEGRKAVAKTARGFEGVPKDLRMFYLERLVMELRERVEGLDGEGKRTGEEERR